MTMAELVELDPERCYNASRLQGANGESQPKADEEEKG
jgi:hypothetical protein